MLTEGLWRDTTFDTQQENWTCYKHINHLKPHSITFPFATHFLCLVLNICIRLEFGIVFNMHLIPTIMGLLKKVLVGVIRPHSHKVSICINEYFTCSFTQMHPCLYTEESGTLGDTWINQINWTWHHQARHCFGWSYRCMHGFLVVCFVTWTLQFCCLQFHHIP